MTNNMYRVEKILNNNVILTKKVMDNSNYILMGKGLGFNKKVGQEVLIEKKDIEKRFHNYDEKFKNDFIDTITSFNKEVVSASTKIIKMAEKKLGPLNSHVFIALTDHISFAIERLREDKDINNPFLYQIKTILVEEYKVAKEASKIIKDEFDIEIPENEIGFIAFHLNAAKENIDVQNVVKEMRIYKDIVEILESKEQIFTEDDKYPKLLNFIQNLIKGKKLEYESIFCYLSGEIENKFLKEYKLSTEICRLIDEELEISTSKNKILLLTMYIKESLVIK